MRVLVVDDSATMRRIVLNTMKQIGYADLVEAADGQEALAKCDGSIGMVITDWNMPVMTGLELVRALRTRPDTAGLPVIMVTTRGAKEDILQAIEAGVNNYILKPFDGPMLKAKIDAVLAARQAA
jgi:two-component system, chemotaxis family, chemotaxis protein CheY